MILAAGLTPAWQQIMVFDRFQLGEVNRASQVHWCASGKVLNVGLALHHLGAPSQTLSLLGGRAYQAIDEEFARLGVPRHWVRSATPTRTCTTILEGISWSDSAPAGTDRAGGPTTELVENAAAPTAHELAEFRAAYERIAAAAELVVLTGSLPAGASDTYFADLLRATRGRVILDVRGPELLAALEYRPFLVKPNRDELARTCGHSLDSDAALLAAMRNLLERGAAWVVVTQGKDAVWVCSGGETHCLHPTAVSVVNPIGCGDCLAAGLAWALHRGCGVVDAVRYGMAAAAENARQLLPARLDPAKVEALSRTIERSAPGIP